jgi:hypothetical protein
MIAREGDVAPGTVGAVFGNLTGMTLYLNDRGQVVFQASLLGGDVVSGVNDSGLFAYDPQLGLTMALRKGELLEATVGNYQTITSYGGSQFNNGDGAPLSFNHNGDLVLRANFSGGGAIVAIKVGTLYGIPGQISASTGGNYVMALNAGLARANEAYVLEGPVSGTTPGFTFQGFNIPLNMDAYFDLLVYMPNTFPMNNNFGTLDSFGRALVVAIVPPLPSLSGLVFHHAFVSVGVGGLVTLVSEPVQLTLTP